jgi:hypothetical protein
VRPVRKILWRIELYSAGTGDVAARSKAWVCSPCLLGLRVQNPPGHGCLSLVNFVCCQVEVSVTGWLFVQRSTTECGVSEYDLGTSKMRRPSPTRAVVLWKKTKDILRILRFVVPNKLITPYNKLWLFLLRKRNMFPLIDFGMLNTKMVSKRLNWLQFQKQLSNLVIHDLHTIF